MGRRPKPIPWVYVEPDLRIRYLTHASYFFVRSVGRTANLISAAHRVAAGRTERVMLLAGWAVPTREEVMAHAKNRFPTGVLISED